MKQLGSEVILEESPFTFDVWCCPKCRHVVTVEQYKQLARDFECAGCQSAALSEYRLWPGTPERGH